MCRVCVTVVLIVLISLCMRFVVIFLKFVSLEFVLIYFGFTFTNGFFCGWYDVACVCEFMCVNSMFWNLSPLYVGLCLGMLVPVH